MATKETILIRYMLRSLGIPADKPTVLMGDHASCITSCTKPGSLCKKKHSMVVHHYAQECQARGEILVKKIDSSHNVSDAGTKAFTKTSFWAIMNHVFASNQKSPL